MHFVALPPWGPWDAAAALICAGAVLTMAAVAAAPLVPPQELLAAFLAIPIPGRPMARDAVKVLCCRGANDTGAGGAVVTRDDAPPPHWGGCAAATAEDPDHPAEPGPPRDDDDDDDDDDAIPPPKCCR